MDKIISLVWEQISPWLLIPALALGWFLHKTGIVGHFLSARDRRDDRESKERIAEEDRESVSRTAEADRLTAFNDTLLAELSEVRRRHALDISEYKRQLEEARLDALDARKDARKWRHLCGSFSMAILSYRRVFSKHGIADYPRVDLSQFVAEGGDPTEFEGLDGG